MYSMSLGNLNFTCGLTEGVTVGSHVNGCSYLIILYTQYYCVYKIKQ